MRVLSRHAIFALVLQARATSAVLRAAGQDASHRPRGTEGRDGAGPDRGAARRRRALHGRDASLPAGAPVRPGAPCSCSPVEYRFRLDLAHDCRRDDVDGAPGIAATLCLADAFAGPVAEVVSIQFLEFDTSDALVVIHQDDASHSRTRASLADGDVVAFRSVAADLDPDLPLAEQLDKVPGGVQLVLRGRAPAAGAGAAAAMVTHRITLGFTNACDAMPLARGDGIGWLTVDGLTPATGDFCPAIAAPSAATALRDAATATTATEPPPSAATATAATEPRGGSSAKASKAWPVDPKAQKMTVKSAKSAKSAKIANSAKSAKSAEPEHVASKAAKTVFRPDRPHAAAGTGANTSMSV